MKYLKPFLLISLIVFCPLSSFGTENQDILFAMQLNRAGFDHLFDGKFSLDIQPSCPRQLSPSKSGNFYWHDIFTSSDETDPTSWEFKFINPKERAQLMVFLINPKPVVTFLGKEIKIKKIAFIAEETAANKAMVLEVYVGIEWSPGNFKMASLLDKDLKFKYPH
jgi:hypothetical protein